MKTKLSAKLSALCLICLLAGTTSASLKETQGETIYTQTFDNPKALADFSIQRGQWTIQNHQLKAESLKGQNKILLPDIASGSDIALQADVRFVKTANQTRWFSLMLRVSPTSPHYFTHTAIRLNQGIEITNAMPPTKGPYWKILTSDSLWDRKPPTEMKTYRLELRQSTARLFVNHRLRAEVKLPDDSSPYGRAGFLTDHATVLIDNIVVQKLPPLSPQEKAHIRSRLIARPAVIAHRGYSQRFPENTLIAFTEAIKAGAQGVEVDARLSRDGIPYCLHDTTLDRTTDGTGKPQGLTMAELKRLDAGAYKGKQFKGTRIPTFEEVLIALKDKACILIDLKEIAAADALCDCIAKHQAADQVIVATTHQATARKFHERVPGCRLIYITGSLTSFTPSLLFSIKRQHYDAIFPRFTLPLRFDPQQVRLMGLSFYAWTINTPEAITQAWLAGIDAIITDRPAMAAETLKTCVENALKHPLYQDF